VTLGKSSAVHAALVDTFPFDPMEATSEASFIERVCMPLLGIAQNEDGGWGFHPRSQSRVEPACWALLALLNSSSSQEMEERIARGFRFLRAAQLPDGSWPSSPAERAGCWVSSLACWVLSFERGASQAHEAGLQWVCKDWPRDSSLWSRLLRRLSAGRNLSPHNDSYRGWGWTPRTSSWVEPTSFALIALSRGPSGMLPNGAPRRRQLAEAMLYDRMCPGGGWNCGNPMIYGVPGEPLVIPTVWALLALRDYPERAENVLSLDWLEKDLENIHGPGSVALARICIEAYGRKWPASAPQLRDFHRKNEFLQNIPVIAWACLASGTREHWLAKASEENPQ
jgi:hypothetical protein